MRPAPSVVSPPPVRLWTVLALVALAAAGVATPAAATSAAADRYKLAHTYSSELGNWSFGSAIDTDAARVYVAAQYETVDGTQFGGAVHVFDASTGAFVRRLVSPVGGGAGFGAGLALAGDLVVIGERAGKGPGESRGVVHLFDAATGAHVRAIPNPSADPERRAFGSALAVAGTRLLVGAPSSTTYAAPATELFVFDLPSGDLVDTLTQPAGGYYFGFGSDVVQSGDAIVVGNYLYTPNSGMVGIAYVYDAASGDFVRALENPDPWLISGFATALAPLGSAVAVGAVGFSDSSPPLGAVFIMDLASGGIIHTLLPLDPKSIQHFGTSLATVGANLLVGAPARNQLPGSATYLFDPVSGELSADFTKIGTVGFGETVASRGTDVLVAATIKQDDAGVVFHYVVTCGDGVLDGCETCDDGNPTPGDGCDETCTLETCGNGVLEAGEPCDDGNSVDGDGCDHGCLATGCGNCVVTAGEICDDGNTSLEDHCDTNCTVPACGNGVIGPLEGCDDTNTIGGDGCSAACKVEACGDGFVDAGESCDDGNAIDGDGCAANCRLETRRLDWWKKVFTIPDREVTSMRSSLLTPAGILIREPVGFDEERHRLYDRDDGTLIHTFTETYATNEALVGDDIAITDVTIPGQVNLYDGTTLALRQSYVDPNGGFGFGSAITRVGSHVLITDFGGVHVFDAASGTFLRTIAAVSPNDGVDFGSHLAPLGALALVSGAQAVYVFDPATGALVRTLAGPDGAAVLGRFFVALDDQRVLLPTKEGPVHVVDATTGAVLHTFVTGPPRFVSGGVTIAVLDGAIYLGASDALHVFDATTYAFRRSIVNPEPSGCFGYPAPSTTPFGLAASDLCYGSSFDGIIYVLDPTDDRPLAVIPKVGGGASEEHVRVVATYGTTILSWTQPDENSEYAAIDAFRPCADGVLEPGEECDDGNLESGDGCDLNCTVTRCGNGLATAGEACDEGTPGNDRCAADCTIAEFGTCDGGVALDHPRLLIRNLGAPLGDEKLVLSGHLDAPPDASPATTGVQVLITDDAGATLFDLTAGTTPIPPGSRGRDACDKRDGWRSDRHRDVYVNRSDTLGPGCVPGSAHGLDRFVFQRGKPGARSTFVLRASDATIAAPTGSPHVTVILGSRIADGLQGHCGTHTFASLDCRLNRTGTTLRCD